MGLLRWFTRNWANTREPTHPDLAPLNLPVATGSAADAVRKAVAALPHWNVESEVPGELKLTRRTRTVGFVDDVTVTIEPAGPGRSFTPPARAGSESATWARTGGISSNCGLPFGPTHDERAGDRQGRARTRPGLEAETVFSSRQALLRRAMPARRPRAQPTSPSSPPTQIDSRASVPRSRSA